jgi:transposase-like protein
MEVLSMEQISFLSDLYLNKKITNCIHCGSDHIVHNGIYRDRQRYKCNDCKKSFNTLSDTPLARTRHIDKWVDFANCLANGLSLRKSAEIVNITYVSLFYWRHKLLFGLNNTPSKCFTDKVEMQDMYLLPSKKGGKKIY